LRTIALVFGRVVGRALFVAASACSFASPAAAIEADFNGDGVADRVVLPRPPDTYIVVRVSGGFPQVLKTHDRIVAIVAADVNHDGDIDLSALSERRGVFVWLNKGKASNGHFRALKRRHHPGTFSLSTRGPLASAPERRPDGAPATSSQDDRDSANQERSVHEFNPLPTIAHNGLILPALPDDRGGASPSRAPPLALLTRHFRPN